MPGPALTDADADEPRDEAAPETAVPEGAETAVPEGAASSEGPPEAPAGKPPKRRRRARTIVLSVLLVLVLLVAGGVGGAVWYVRHIDSSIARIDAFQDVPVASRPEKVIGDATNMLLLGSDSRDPDSTAGSRSDTIILVHIPQDRQSAQLISIPRDTWVHIPLAKNGRDGNQDAKINAAYALGGIPLTVQTVESFTGVRIDHVVVIDFAGFKEIVDALGGVDIKVEENFRSIHPPYRQFVKGTQHMDGATALDYARQRKQFADGDFARIRHQQQVITAILDKAASGGLLSSPTQLNGFLQATANAVSVDQTLSIVGMANDLQHLRAGNLTFLTIPTKGTGTVGTQSVVFASPDEDKALFDAVRRDAVAEILAAGKK
jgi:LCP family protein required for cell wall assembly